MKIFVFGSNLAGRHGKGAALFAKNNHGAIYGVGEGIQGSSYGVPTKDGKLKVLSLQAIKIHVDKFIEFSRMNPMMTFNLTPVGCGLAGYKYDEIAPMFIRSPINVILPIEFTTSTVFKNLAIKQTKIKF